MILTRYDICGARDIKIALVSDLHAHDGEEALSLLRQAQPDIICCPGDMLERSAHGCDPRKVHDERVLLRTVHRAMGFADKLLRQANAFLGHDVRRNSTENAYSFFRGAAAIAPVFYSLGNHEWYLKEEDRSLFKEIGVTVLENRHVNFHGMTIGGLSPAADLCWLSNFADLPGEKLLLCHHPEYYERILKGRNMGLILSGHAHGGQFRVKGHGIFAPNQGFFPYYTRGIYDGCLVVSTGCANTVAVPRWGNPTEIVLIKMHQEEMSCEMR